MVKAKCLKWKGRAEMTKLVTMQEKGVVETAKQSEDRERKQADGRVTLNSNKYRIKVTRHDD